MKPETSGIKNKAYLIIISAFAIGVVTGALCMNLVTVKSAVTKKITPQEELSIELQLDQSQRDQVEKTYQELHQQNKRIFNSIQPQLTELRLQTRAKISNILRPDQRLRFDELNRKRDVEREKKPDDKK